MARSREFDLGDIATSLGNPRNHRDWRSILESIVDKISKAPPYTGLLIGTLAGWVSGSASMKIGKIAAFGLGGGVILLHLAKENGYVDVNWDKIREATGRSSILIENIVQFIMNNSYFSAGFIGGFFFGIASV